MQSEKDVINVAAAVILRGDTILAARRAYGDLSDGWEFPGGKIEDGETPEQALRREIREELDAKIDTLWYLDTVEYDYPSFHLKMECFVCNLAHGSEPHMHRAVHEELRWLTRDQLLDVSWLPADRGLVQALGTGWAEIFSANRL